MVRSWLLRSRTLAIGLLVLAVGCAPSTEDVSPTSSEPRVTASFDREQETRSAVLGSYRAMWEDFAHAAETADTRSATLDDHATGDALTILRNGIESMHEDGRIAKGSYELRPTVIALRAKTATVRDCGDTASWREYQASGEPADSRQSSGKQKIDAKLKLIDGAWLITWFRVWDVGSCT